MKISNVNYIRSCVFNQQQKSLDEINMSIINVMRSPALNSILRVYFAVGEAICAIDIDPGIDAVNSKVTNKNGLMVQDSDGYPYVIVGETETTFTCIREDDECIYTFEKNKQSDKLYAVTRDNRKILVK